MALILSVEKCSFSDGPGIRSTVFLKGCGLNCKWCHNPESIPTAKTLSYQKERCVFCGKCETVCPANVHSVFESCHLVKFENCIKCGKCVEACNVNALKIYGYEQSATQVFENVIKDIEFYQNSGGGVTVSGGEPMLQPDFIAELFTLLKNAGVHTCIETSGFAKRGAFEKLIGLTDLFLFDIKADSTRHKSLVGASKDKILENLNFLNKNKANVILRCPLIPEVNDTKLHFEELLEIAKLECVKGIEIMPYHTMGKGKSEQIGKDYLINAKEPTDEQLSRWKSCLEKSGKLI